MPFNELGFNRKEVAKLTQRDRKTVAKYLDLAFEYVEDFRDISAKTSVKKGGKTSIGVDGRVPLSLYQLWVLTKISFFFQSIPSGLAKEKMFVTYAASNPTQFSHSNFDHEREEFWLKVREKQGRRDAHNSSKPSSYSVTNLYRPFPITAS